MSDYKEIVIETYGQLKESMTTAPPARPVPGQGFDTGLKVECSERMRRSHPVGTKFLVIAKLTEAYGTPFLYSSYRWKWRVLSDNETTLYLKLKK